MTARRCARGRVRNQRFLRRCRRWRIHQSFRDAFSFKQKREKLFDWEMESKRYASEPMSFSSMPKDIKQKQSSYYGFASVQTMDFHSIWVWLSILFYTCLIIAGIYFLKKDCFVGRIKPRPPRNDD